MDLKELVEVCAEAVHEANRALCMVQGDGSQISWAETPEENRAVSREGVLAILVNPLLTPKDIHDKWMSEKAQNGWKYGPIKDDKLKTHPSMVSYDQLPQNEKDKDRLFRMIVDTASRSYFTVKAVKVAYRFSRSHRYRG
jgi:hypothetical protein